MIDLTGIVTEFPVCPVCGFPIFNYETVLVAQAEGHVFLVHEYCGDIEFYNA